MNRENVTEQGEMTKDKTLTVGISKKWKNDAIGPRIRGIVSEEEYSKCMYGGDQSANGKKVVTQQLSKRTKAIELRERTVITESCPAENKDSLNAAFYPNQFGQLLRSEGSVNSVDVNMKLEDGGAAGEFVDDEDVVYVGSDGEYME